MGKRFIPLSAEAGIVKTGLSLVGVPVLDPRLGEPVVGTPVVHPGERVAKRKNDVAVKKTMMNIPKPMVGRGRFFRLPCCDLMRPTLRRPRSRIPRLI